VDFATRSDCVSCLDLKVSEKLQLFLTQQIVMFWDPEYSLIKTSVLILVRNAV
jgi:hypothetical protein